MKNCHFAVIYKKDYIDILKHISIDSVQSEINIPGVNTNGRYIRIFQRFFDIMQYQPRSALIKIVILILQKPERFRHQRDITLIE